MYLKALELRGFKSFPERTVLTFEKPLTAIVGPNGSGKSNIADAIQWVMGEQSTRALRGGKMEDVIFGGTEKRSQVGVAEVSLTLDNADRRLGQELDEVQVTRRYYRSGESEYYINKRPVRLKDVNELFMDTGLGRDGYSIIGQGKIDAILSAKSTDRREIFEEAAGISRFRHRKEESERKLERANEDLVRVNDKIGELEMQVEPLRKQSETAKKYLLLRDELRGLEISLWLGDLEALAERTRVLREDSLKSAGDLERARAELERLYAAGEQFSRRMRDKDMEAEALRKEAAGLELAVADEESGVAVLRANLEHINENISRVQEEISRRDDQSSGLLDQINERRERLARIESEKAEIAAELERLRRDAEGLFAGEGAYARKLSALNGDLNGTLDKLSAARVELGSLAASVREMDERMAAVREELTAQTARVESADAESAENRKALGEAEEKARSLQNVCRGYELRAGEVRRRAEVAADKRAKTEMEYNAARSRRQLLADMEREYEGYSKAVKTVMREADRGVLRGVHGPAGELIKTDDRCAVAIETALGAAVQNIVVSTDNDGKNVINYLKRLDAGRVTLLPMNVIRGSRLLERGLEDEDGFEGLAYDLVKFERQYNDIFLNLLGRVAVADDMDSAVRIARKYGHRFRIVTLDGQVVNAGGSMTGGSAARNTGILSRANELLAVTERESRLAADLESAKKDADEQKRAAAALEYEIRAANDTYRTAQDGVLKLTAAKEHYDLLLVSLRERLEELETESAAVARRRAEAQTRADALAETVASLEAEAGRLRGAIDDETDGHEALTAKREEISRAESDLREKRACLDAESASGEEAVAELERLRGELAGDRRTQEEAVRLLREKAAETGNDIAARRRKADGIRAEAAKRKEEIARLTDEKLSIEAERARSDKLLQEKNNALLELERSAARIENKVEAAAMEEKQILDKLWEGYGLTRSAAMEQRLELSSVPQARRRTGELKREMSSLGTPNLGAIEEFERVNARYTYLTDQRDDIERARRELLGIIGEITGSMETIFKEEFERIDEGFRQTFLELFGGGHASLSLEDPEDVLGSGIEIRVQPPGKSLKTITLLSGGEKAFVAIALYFAILKVRPTPFVVMDEIEAALDDANVIKVARYMRSLTGKTQFLTITHRRGTMEEADVLYGVTMQEKGVSKVLAIDLDEAEKQIGKS